MKKTALLALSAVLVSGANAGAFTAGDVVVYRVGDGAGSLLNTGAKIFLDEYTTGGTLVQSIDVSGNVSPNQAGVIASGTATSEGLLTLSPNGQFLTLSGYNSFLPAASSLSGTAAATTNRSVVVYGGAGTQLSQTNLTDWADANNPRSALTTDGTNLWLGGAAGGVRYTTAGSTTSTQLSTTLTNIRQIESFGGQLYESDSSGSAVRIGSVGTGMPTTSGQTITNLPGFPVTGSPYGFYMADLSSAVSGLDTLYVTDDTANTLTKFSLVSGSWVSNGSVTATAIRGLAASVNGSTVSLFDTTGGNGATGGGSIYAIADSSGYNGAFSGTVNTIATAGANESFRGIAFAPTAVPEPASLAALGIGALALLRRRNRK